MLLAIFAHPDDESFSVAGTLSRYHREGRELALVTATDGEAGRVTGVRADDRKDVATLRRRELLEAAGVLGVDRIFTLGHPDGGLDLYSGDALIAELTGLIRRIRPEVILTFGPEGAPNTHADHRAVSRAATAAFFLAGLTTALPGTGEPWRAGRLYYVTWTGRSGPNGGVEGLPVTCRVDITSEVEVKRAAFAAHRSQQHHIAHFEEELRPHEEFFLVSGVRQPETITQDLFAGLPGRAG
ncbi:MAG TPA: PIG-L family deacetylase [Gemmatimonadales bacterium]|nr:PIG-L family deacetylase [Gemmatimonadales bacterium]